MEQEMKQAVLPVGRAADLLHALFDEGTFTQIGAHVKGRCAANAEQAAESVFTCYGAVDGRPVFAFIQDGNASRGVMTAAHAAKICRLYEMAIKSHAPVVGVFSGDGAAVEEGTELLTGYARIMRCMRDASRRIPQIALIDGVCAGASAVLASMMDLRVMTNGASMFVGAPFLLREIDSETPFGTPEFSGKQGDVDLISADASDVRRLLSYLPSDTSEGNVICPSGDDINAPAGIDLDAPMSDIIASILDGDTFLPIAQTCAAEIITGLGVLNDRVIGVVATDPAIGGGKITAKGAKKAARLLSLCTRMRIPVLTLVDSCGIACTPCDEKHGIASALAALAAAYADCTSPVVTVLLGKAYGSAYTLLGNRALGADVVFATEKAEIGTLSPEAAVELTMRDKLRAGENREALTAAYRKTMMNPYVAAENGDIDCILSDTEIRPRVAAALEMLALKDGKVE